MADNLLKSKVVFVITRTIIVSVLVFLFVGLPVFELGKALSLIILSSLVVYFLVRFFEKKPFSIIGLSLSGKNILKTLAAGSLIGGGLLIGVALLQLFTGAIKFEHFIWENNQAQMLVPLLGLIIHGGIAFWEEIVFRGYFLRILEEKVNFVPAALVSSLIFALLHLVFNPGSLIVFINLSLLGILFALTMTYFRSLWAAIGVHFAWNWVQYFGFYVTRGREALGILNFSENPGMHWLFTGNIQYESEATVFTTLVLLFAVWYFGRRIFNKNWQYKENSV